jgi:uncharacterized protein
VTVRRTVALLLALLLLAALPATARSADGPREDATWTEHYIPSGDGLTTLHADVLRPAHLPADEPTPVILTVSPYTNHSGATTDYNPTASGPSDRFFDFLDESGALSQGYTYVIVDLPGNGGSGGCNDWGGEREQAAVVTAVEWAAAQEWSNGKVALLGKSYDAWTGLMGVANQPEGLAAVIAMAPVYSGYRYLYTDGVRYPNSVATPALFQAIDAKPGPLTNPLDYHVSGAPQAWCYGVNLGLAQQDEPDAPYWAERDLLPPSVDASTPVFLTQGFIETNTKPDAAFAYWNGLDLGEGSRAWFGQFDHDRGNDRCGERFCTGRGDFIAQAMAFLDTHLKGVPAEDSGLADVPVVSVQDNHGRYRAEPSWPAADAVALTTELATGSYADDGGNRGSGAGTAQGLATVSDALPHRVWLSGEPELTATVTTQVPRTNLVANVYAVDAAGGEPGGSRAVLVSRGATLLRDVGTQEVTVPMYGQDWVLDAGQHLMVVVSGANSEWWTHVPTRTTVTVEEAAIDLPFLTVDRTEFEPGAGASPRLERWLENRRITVPMGASTRPFAIPEPLVTPAG